jgi:hypothetical protein
MPPKKIQILRAPSIGEVHALALHQREGLVVVSADAREEILSLQALRARCIHRCIAGRRRLKSFASCLILGRRRHEILLTVRDVVVACGVPLLVCCRRVWDTVWSQWSHL